MFLVDPLSRQPVYEQIIAQVERFVLSGVLKAGDQLPSVRSLSVTLSINPNTIQKAYYDLDRRDILQTVPGKGCFISEHARQHNCEQKRGELNALDELVRELALAGVTEQELNARIQRIYDQRRAKTL